MSFERLARAMLAAEPALGASFGRRLHDDPAFAADPRARLMFFFERSPWYAAQDVGAYPVLRLSAAQLRALDEAPAYPSREAMRGRAGVCNCSLPGGSDPGPTPDL